MWTLSPNLHLPLIPVHGMEQASFYHHSFVREHLLSSSTKLKAFSSAIYIFIILFMKLRYMNAMSVVKLLWENPTSVHRGH